MAAGMRITPETAGRPHGYPPWAKPWNPNPHNEEQGCSTCSPPLLRLCFIFDKHSLIIEAVGKQAGIALELQGLRKRGYH